VEVRTAPYFLSSRAPSFVPYVKPGSAGGSFEVFDSSRCHTATANINR